MCKRNQIAERIYCKKPINKYNEKGNMAKNKKTTLTEENQNYSKAYMHTYTATCLKYLKIQPCNGIRTNANKMNSNHIQYIYLSYRTLLNFLFSLSYSDTHFMLYVYLRNAHFDCPLNVICCYLINTMITDT